MASPFAFILGLVLLAYGVWLRRSILHWRFTTGRWGRRWTAPPLHPRVTFVQDGQAYEASVSTFAAIYEEPLRLLVSDDGRRAHVAGTEFIYMGLGLFLCAIQVASLF